MASRKDERIKEQNKLHEQKKVQSVYLPKSKVTISISHDVRKRLIEAGQEYGLKLSNMIERAARYYLAEIEDLEIAMWRTKNSEGEAMTHEQVGKAIGLDTEMG